jgi:hypothetical protein
MQLHPEEPEQALKRTVESLGAKYIGLDFSRNVGDLMRVDKSELPENQRNYFAFADEMREGDRVLIFVHNFPFALVTVEGPYNYIREIAPEIGVWFRHFRRVKDISYYGDVQTDARKWEWIPMPATIMPLRDPSGDCRELIENWLRRIGALSASTSAH